MDTVHMTMKYVKLFCKLSDTKTNLTPKQFHIDFKIFLDC